MNRIRRLLYGNHPLNLYLISRGLLKPGYGKMELWRWRLLNYLYTWIRFIRDKDFDINEEYCCEECGKPVLRNLLYCSVECSEKDDREKE